MKKSIFIIITVIIITVGIIGIVKYQQHQEEEKQQKLIEEQKKAKEQKIATIKSHYNDYVKTNKDATIYLKNGEEYQNAGKIAQDIILTLEETEIDENTQYFYAKELEYYISYEDVEIAENDETPSQRYKSYVVFNQNVVTDKVTNLYQQNKLIYTFDKSMEFPIWIKEDDKYYVEFNDELYYVLAKEVSVQKKDNTKEQTRTDIRTLTYHTVYDKETQKCSNTVICHPTTQFDEHMKYLSENGYLTLTMEELEMFLDGKIRIPQKSIVVTLDDGRYAQNAVDIVEKYKVYATYFIITGKHDVSKIKSTYMDFESHSDNLHNNWVCPGGNQGGQILCDTEENIIADLKLSQEKLGGAISFAYPFFDYNERAITLLKKVGIRLAFIGQYNTDGFSDTTTNRYMLRRKTIFSYDTMDTFKSYLN